MWEFHSRKKETPAPVPEASIVFSPIKTESAPKAEAATEQAAESASEQYANILTPSSTTTPVSPQDIDTDASSIGQAVDTVSRVNQLVELAQIKGVAHAVAVARKMHDLYVLDTMHDELVDKLYDALKAKGLIQGE